MKYSRITANLVFAELFCLILRLIKEDVSLKNIRKMILICPFKKENTVVTICRISQAVRVCCYQPIRFPIIFVEHTWCDYTYQMSGIKLKRDISCTYFQLILTEEGPYKLILFDKSPTDQFLSWTTSSRFLLSVNMLWSVLKSASSTEYYWWLRFQTSVIVVVVLIVRQKRFSTFSHPNSLKI